MRNINEFISSLSIEQIKNLSENDIISILMKRPGFDGQYGFLLDPKYFKSKEHFVEVFSILIDKLKRIENIDYKINKRDKYRYIFNEAYNILKTEVSENDLLLHFNNDYNFNSINDIYKGIIFSSQNRSMMPNVIKFNQKEIKIKEILFNYNVSMVLKKYNDAEGLLSVFKNNFSDIKATVDKKSLWYKFCESILSGANFLSIFNDRDDFDRFVKGFNINKYTKAALPMLLSREISGFGFALACDFLKELGYRDYPKPDIHLIDIFYGIGISTSKNDYDVYKDIVEFSEIIGEDAYTVDRVFWLIGSGNFYRINKKTKSKKAEFIDLINRKI